MLISIGEVVTNQSKLAAQNCVDWETNAFVSYCLFRPKSHESFNSAFCRNYEYQRLGSLFGSKSQAICLPAST
jgi:hypothetical protein